MSTAFVGVTPVYPRSQYVGELRSGITATMLEPARSRIALVPLHVAIIAVAILAIAHHWVPWPVVPLLSLVIGGCFAGLTFVGHELLHGGILRTKRLQRLFGWVTFAPFLLSPQLWTIWHNRIHHANTNLPDDPDGYATLERYLARRSTRFSVDAFSLGGKRWRGGLSLILGFTVQGMDQLFSAPFMAKRDRRIAYTEAGLAVALWATVALLIGVVPFVFAYILPVLIANACVMAFILTNHSLSPRLTIDDPLLSGLSVTTSKLVQWISLGFGFHVEHHLFPAISSRHAPAVRALVHARWPERYQSMPLAEALGRLHRTARVYKDDTTLFDPMTGAEFPTLLPR